jgi:hypothetical protein
MELTATWDGERLEIGQEVTREREFLYPLPLAHAHTPPYCYTT